MLKQTLIQALSRLWNIQIVRQLIGAVLGGSFALMLYSAYGHASDAVQAYLLSDEPGEETAEVTTEEQRAANFELIGELAREKKEELQ